MLLGSTTLTLYYMKQLCAKICLVTALLFTGTIAAMAQTQNAIISFLKEVPKGLQLLGEAGRGVACLLSFWLCPHGRWERI